jgi:hypothetical protein
MSKKSLVPEVSGKDQVPALISRASQHIDLQDFQAYSIGRGVCPGRKTSQRIDVDGRHFRGS